MEEMIFKGYKFNGNILGEVNIFFDFDNSTIQVEDGKIWNVEDDNEYTYKILKTKIKAVRGIKGLYDFFDRANSSDSPFNGDTYFSLTKRGVLD